MERANWLARVAAIFGPQHRRPEAYIVNSQNGQDEVVHVQVPESVLLKVTRAHDLHQELVQAVTATPLRAPCSTRLSTDAMVLEVLRPDALPPVPPKWIGILGDCLHNLRSSLDVLLWALIEHFGTGHEPRAAQLIFPVCKTESEWREAEKLLADLLPVKVVQQINLLQPYLTEPPEHHFLATLSRLDNTAKHRFPVRPGVAILSWELSGAGLSFPEVKEGTGQEAGEAGVVFAHLIDEVAVGEPILGLTFGIPGALSAPSITTHIEVGAELVVEPDGPVNILDLTATAYSRIEEIILRVLISGGFSATPE